MEKPNFYYMDSGNQKQNKCVYVCMDDVIYEAESALCNINKYHLQLCFLKKILSH